MPPRAGSVAMSRSIGDGLLHLARHTSRPLLRATPSAPISLVIRRAIACPARPEIEYRPRRTSSLGTRLSGVQTRSLAARALDGFSHSNHYQDVEHILVPCASSGHIVVSLYNVREHPPTAPLLLYLPPTPAPFLGIYEGVDVRDHAQQLVQLPEHVLASLQPPPDYLLRQNFPIVAIHYRWSPGKTLDDKDIAQDQDQVVLPSDLWPRPLHDVMFAYDWVKRHLSPPLSASVRGGDGRRHFLRRDFYVYGSYLSASLATSLALTETHPQHRVAIRGVAAYNGIYNWTAYVGMTEDSIPVADRAETVQSVTPGIQPLPLLFRKPTDLFDAFASPCLFFRTTGHLIAPLDLDEDTSRQLLEENEARLEEEEEKGGQKADQAFGKRTFSIELLGTSRKVYLGFPPLKSTLCIPSALFLHTSETEPPATASKPARARKPNSRPRKIPESSNGHNSFAIQADEIMSLMRRSIDKVEIKRQRDKMPSFVPEYSVRRLDESDAATQTSESEQRVRIASIAAPTDDSLSLGKDGQKLLLDWLDEHMTKGLQ